MHAWQWPDGEAARKDGGTLLIGDDGISVRSTESLVETWTGRQTKTL